MTSRSVHFRDMAVVCAWCERTMLEEVPRPAPALQARRVSHGICRTCLDATLASPPLPSVLASQPARWTLVAATA